MRTVPEHQDQGMYAYMYDIVHSHKKTIHNVLSLSTLLLLTTIVQLYPMITSFFAPKKSSTGSKRSRPDGDDGGGGSKRVATPFDQNSTSTKKTKTSSNKLTVETSTLLSYLHHCDGEEVSWRGVLEDYFATAKFSSLASFIAKER